MGDRSSASASIRRGLSAFWRRISLHPPLAYFVFACSAVGTALAYFYPEGSSFTAVRDCALLAALACSLCFLVGRSAAAFRILLALKVLAAIVLLAGGWYRGGIEAVLLMPLLLEIAVYEAFFLNLLVSICVAALSVPVRAVALGQPGDGTAAWMPSSLAFLLYLLCFSAAACLLIHYRERCIEQQERISRLEGAVERLTETNLGYQNYANEASALSQKEERLRITRELHDVIGYTFTNNIMMLEAAVSKIHKDPQKVRELITMARAGTETGLASVRKTLYLLRSQEPVRVPSARKIAELVRIFRLATGVEVGVDFSNFPNDLDPDREGVFYAFVQQSLINAFRHGSATAIAVQLLRTDRSLIAMVSDNGRGAESITEGIGIHGMRERLAQWGGELRLSLMRGGFRIVAEMPYAEGDEGGS